MAHRIPTIPPNSVKILSEHLGRIVAVKCLQTSPEIILWCSHARVCSKTDDKYFWYEVEQLIINIKSDRDWNVQKSSVWISHVIHHTFFFVFICLSHFYAQMRPRQSNGSSFSLKKTPSKSFFSFFWLHTAFKARCPTVHARLLVTWCNHLLVYNAPSSSTSTICKIKVKRIDSLNVQNTKNVNYIKIWHSE